MKKRLLSAVLITLLALGAAPCYADDSEISVSESEIIFTNFNHQREKGNSIIMSGIKLGLSFLNSKRKHFIVTSEWDIEKSLY